MGEVLERKVWFQDFATDPDDAHDRDDESEKTIGEESEDDKKPSAQADFSMHYDSSDNQHRPPLFDDSSSQDSDDVGENSDKKGAIIVTDSRKRKAKDSIDEPKLKRRKQENEADSDDDKHYSDSEADTNSEYDDGDESSKMSNATAALAAANHKLEAMSPSHAEQAEQAVKTSL
jgi:hypothetical protein